MEIKCINLHPQNTGWEQIIQEEMFFLDFVIFLISQFLLRFCSVLNYIFGIIIGGCMGYYSGKFDLSND